MTKKELIELFPKISPTAIQIGQDGAEIRGKWAVVTPMGGVWDVWIRNPKSPTDPLSTRRVRNVLRNVKDRVKTNFHEADGEAWFQLSNHEDIARIAPLLGIRKKKIMAEAQLAALKKNQF